jgi:hypothetical protein
MQQPQSNGFRGGTKIVQSALQLLLSRVQSSINNSTSDTHLSGRGMRDLEQVALRGPPLTADDLVSFLPLPAHNYSCLSHAPRSRRSQTLYATSMAQSTTESFLQVLHITLCSLSS